MDQNILILVAHMHACFELAGELKTIHVERGINIPTSWAPPLPSYIYRLPLFVF
jgi:hypothetical protein